MRAAYYVVKRMLQRTGVVGGLGRILNHETGAYMLGYTEINTMATTPFGRTKTHKAWFSGDAVVKNGDLVEDRVDNTKYLVMSIKAEFTGGLIAYYDGTLYLANSTCEVHRVDDSIKDKFGRTVQDWAVVHTDVPLMVNPLAMDATESETGMIDNSKIKVAMQMKYAIREGDRIVTPRKTFIVRSIDDDSLENLYTLHVEKDTR